MLKAVLVTAACGLRILAVAVTEHHWNALWALITGYCTGAKVINVVGSVCRWNAVVAVGTDSCNCLARSAGVVYALRITLKSPAKILTDIKIVALIRVKVSKDALSLACLPESRCAWSQLDLVITWPMRIFSAVLTRTSFCYNAGLGHFGDYCLIRLKVKLFNPTWFLWALFLTVNYCDCWLSCGELNLVCLYVLINRID